VHLENADEDPNFYSSEETLEDTDGDEDSEADVDK
jgi:hypothetical protein